MVYTAFCRNTDGEGTTWISPIKADGIEEAKRTACIECSIDWGCERDDVECIGLAAGDVRILFWDDAS